MQQYLQNKKGLVQNVFDQVYDQYDLMNDLMSLGIHRIWKKNLLNMMNPSANQNLIDVACGTGDIAKIYLKYVDREANITCIDPNELMIGKGKEKLSEYKNLEWIISAAEKLPVSDNKFDFYTISFGLRNTKNIEKAIKEAYRVLKPGGRFLCLEFSKIQNSKLDFLYNKYSKIIPSIGKIIVGDEAPYKYLIKSIENFLNQDELIELMNKNGFNKCTYRNFSGGIVSIHSGWKI
tara:strand:- start:9250 stop:9954 length:705 start_codon:yes stop_codon:yes gene_type:complete